MNINFAGHELTLHSSGVLFWPQKSILIVSDMHLEKGSHFAQRGFFLPPYDTLETLKRLINVIEFYKPETLIALGDTFHDVQGYARMAEKERILFSRMLQYKPIWITGNHDGDFVPEGFAAHKTLTIDNITFNHEAHKNTEFEISGHYHPKVEIKHKSARISRPCFIEDGNKMILPAFGNYAGGLSISDKAIKQLFKEPRVYALGQKIYVIENF